MRAETNGGTTRKGWTSQTLQARGVKHRPDGGFVFDTTGGSLVYYDDGREPKTKMAAGGTREMWPAPETIAGESLIVVEGEPDVLSMLELGYTNVISLPGTSYKPNAERVERLTAGRTRIDFICDFDTTGRAFMWAWAEAVAGKVWSAVVDIEPNCNEGDIGDFLAESLSNNSQARRYVRSLVDDRLDTAEPIGGGGSHGRPLREDDDYHQPRKGRYEDRLVDLGALLSAPEEPTPWRVKPLVADATLTVLSGVSGSSKSLLAEHLCLGVSRGESVAGMTCTQGVALYIDAEMGQRMFIARLKLAGVTEPEFHYIDALGLDISRADDLRWFETVIRQLGANLVVIDSLRRLVPSKSENDSDDMAPTVATMTKLARDTGAAIVLIHHKGDGSKFYRGSTAIRDQADALFALLREDEDEDDDESNPVRRLRCRGGKGKMRYAEEPPDVYMEIGLTGATAVVRTGGEPSRPRRSVQDELREAILGALPARTKTAVAEAIGRVLGDRSFREAWTVLEREESIRQVGGEWVVVVAPDPRGMTTSTTSSRNAIFGDEED